MRKKGGEINVKKGRKKGSDFSRKTSRECVEWQMDFLDSIQNPAKNLPCERDLMDGEARSCVENSRRESHDFRSNFSNREPFEIPAPWKRAGILLPLFFRPLLSLLSSIVLSVSSVGLFIFAVSKRVTDDGTMLIPPMWEPIVTRSVTAVERQRSYDFGPIRRDTRGEESIWKRAASHEYATSELLGLCVYGGGGEDLNGGTESSWLIGN